MSTEIYIYIHIYIYRVGGLRRGSKSWGTAPWSQVSSRPLRNMPSTPAALASLLASAEGLRF